MKMILIAFVVLTSGCSSSVTKSDPELDKKVKAQPEANTSEAIAARAAKAFASAPGLTDQQRVQLLKIYQKTYAEASQIRKDIGQNKSLLFELVSTTDYHSGDVEKLKSRIVELDQRRLKIMFKALDDVQEVVGYGKEKMELYKYLRDYEFPHESPFLSDTDRRL